MNILIAEDDPTSSFILQKILEKDGHLVTSAHDGVEALYKIQKEKYDALLTDWMMPQMDGMELIKRVRMLIKPPPFLLVITSLATKEARQHALLSGADEYLIKPVHTKELLELLNRCELKKRQSPRGVDVSSLKSFCVAPPPFIGVVIGASSGGPMSLKKVFQHIEYTTSAAFFVVLHGPSWMLETFAETLQKDTKLSVHVAGNNQVPETGHVYISPGEKHLILENKQTLTMLLDDSPAENYVKPAIDPLFRSAAKVFGNSCISVILTGMGCDGALGAAHIAREKGIVIAQDPKTAIVGSMPEAAIEMGIVKDILPLDKIGEIVSFYIKNLSTLKKNI